MSMTLVAFYPKVYSSYFLNKNNKPVLIKFFTPVIDVTINALMNAIDQKMKQEVADFIILISSPENITERKE